MKTLYKKASTGKIQQWTVKVEGNVVTSIYGQTDGKLQETSDTIKEGKNLGRANATTKEEQAVLKAQQLYDKKIKEGYVTDLAQASKGESSLMSIDCMLAFPIEKKMAHVKFPAIVQPKLDGMRCIAIIKDGFCKLFSRTQKEILTMPHIVEQLEAAFVEGTVILDGELYNHDLKDDFNKIMSIIKRDELHPEHELVQYHIYDTVSELPYIERMNQLHHLIEPTKESFVNPKYKNIRILDYKKVNNHDEVMESFANYLADQYEGLCYDL